VKNSWVKNSAFGYSTSLRRLALNLTLLKKTVNKTPMLNKKPRFFFNTLEKRWGVSFSKSKLSGLSEAGEAVSINVIMLWPELRAFE
jgi:hypothetical protein